MADTSPILRRKTIATLRDADKILADAEALKEKAEADAEALYISTRDRASTDAQRDATTRLAEVVGGAELEAKKRLDALEDDIAALVAETVTQVIGDMDQSEAIRAATRNALTRFADQRRLRLRAAPDVAETIVDATADAGSAVEVTTDPRLEPGRVLVSSENGHAEIGLAALIEAANKPWTERDSHD